MLDRSKIQVDLVKLAGGDRLLRLTHSGSGLALEKKLDAKAPVVRQKEQLFRMLEAALLSGQQTAG
jgi:hypothetical protein